MKRSSKPTHLSYVFKSGTLTDHMGQMFRLELAGLSTGKNSRRPVQLRMVARAKGAKSVPAATLELSQREAYAFSEWLDQALTKPAGG